MGGTLDLSIFYLMLADIRPCTFNIAINLPTTVRLRPYKAGWIKVTSRGFEPAAFPVDKAPLDHPLGLMMAIAGYFHANGMHIDIISTSPPRSALGGSSAAGTALVAALAAAIVPKPEQHWDLAQIVWLTHAIEQSVAGVSCGLQDHLAAAYGGVNAWHWTPTPGGSPYRREAVFTGKQASALAPHLLLAYCGVPHVSKNINQTWVQQFLSGQFRDEWVMIARATQQFVEALKKGDYSQAAAAMNHEMEMRRRLTPDVLDPLGDRLVAAAHEQGCGARITGAGGGGCLWAIGDAENIDRLKGIWEEILSDRAEADLLDAKIDFEGLRVKFL